MCLTHYGHGPDVVHPLLARAFAMVPVSVCEEQQAAFTTGEVCSALAKVFCRELGFGGPKTKVQQTWRFGGLAGQSTA